MTDQILSALIVDDERLARKELISMLDVFDNIEIIGEADSVESASSHIRRKDPDLIFLDIQMPGKNGFDLLDETVTRAKIIFVTAYDEYAIRAFEVNAVDYLTKPVSHERLAKTIERVIYNKPGTDVPYRTLEYSDRLFLEFGSQTRFLKVSEIKCIQADGDYTGVILKDGKKGLVSKSMKEWEERLPEKYFCRIHRSSIINTEYIEKIEKSYNNAYIVKLKDLKESLIISRRYAKKMKGLFS